MSYNVTVSGTNYEGIEKVELPITGENKKATFYADLDILDFICGNITSFESDKLQNNKSDDEYYFDRGYAFSGMKNLETVFLPNLTNIKGYTFDGCLSLKNVNLPSVGIIYAKGFNLCKSLEEITLPKLNTLFENVFNGCTSLKKVDLPLLSSFAGRSGQFGGCTSLETLILRNETMCELPNVRAFENTPITNGTGYIYVPRDLVESYKVATNWTTFATQFRALEDYTVDGTITGELDKTKI